MVSAGFHAQTITIWLWFVKRDVTLFTNRGPAQYQLLRMRESQRRRLLTDQKREKISMPFLNGVEPPGLSQNFSGIGKQKRVYRYLTSQASAMAAMEIRRPGILTGSLAPWRAGGSTGNHFTHSSFIPAKSASSRRITVALTTLSREVPAALRMADTFSRHCLVCS